jgi:hypothetical protein
MAKLLPKHGCSQEQHVPNCGHFGESGAYLSLHSLDCDYRKNSRYECTCSPKAKLALAQDVLELEIKETPRGFRLISFKDRYGIQCSLQKSSLATEPAIWFGCDDADPKVQIPGQSWQPVPMPEGYIANTRMHLTQEQVIILLPYLQAFAETGELPEGSL